MPILELKNSKRENRGYVAFGLLEPGLPQKQAQAEMAVISRNLAGQYRENEKWELVVEPMIENLLRFMKRTMLVLHGAVGFVLLIACSIVASLLLARAATRQKEVSIRLALGATRRQIMRQMLTESVLLALCCGAFGLVLTAMGIQLLKSLLPPIVMDFVTRQGIDIRLLGFTLLLSISTGLLFGIEPALRASKVNLGGTLKEGGRGSGGRMPLAEVMSALESAGSEKTRRTYARHGAKAPLFGVSFATLKTLAKRTRVKHDLALALWDTANVDARNLAVKVFDPARMTPADLDRWAKGVPMRPSGRLTE